jgi:Ca2+-binding EF-hand superfamily protein
MNRNQAIFAQLDANHDGQLSAQEFAAFHADPAPPNAAPMLQHFDANHDGAVTIVEFRAGTLANFDRMDTNKDGVVDAGEMKAAGIGPH